jgi:choline kinase
MIGLVLAAGAGRRLRPYTDTLPKALVPVDGDTTVLDLTLGNFAQIGLTEAAVVVGYRKEAVYERKAALEAKYGLKLTLVDNDKAEEWNNAYSLWCARDVLSEGVILANGDTVHPVSVEHVLMDASADSALLLAVDAVKDLGAEEMKVTAPDRRSVTRITKLMDPAEAFGEYIGVARLGAAVSTALTESLEATWRRDPGLYYEDGFQELIDRGEFSVDVAPIGDVPWVEIDDTADLARARSVVTAIREAQR